MVEVQVLDGRIGSTGIMRRAPANPRAEVDVKLRGRDARPGSAKWLGLGGWIYHGGLRWRVRARTESCWSGEREQVRMLLKFSWLFKE